MLDYFLHHHHYHPDPYVLYLCVLNSFHCDRYLKEARIIFPLVT